MKQFERDDLLTQLETCLNKVALMTRTVIEDHFSKPELSERDARVIRYEYGNICTALEISDDYLFKSREIVAELLQGEQKEE